VAEENITQANEAQKGGQQQQKAPAEGAPRGEGSPRGEGAPRGGGFPRGDRGPRGGGQRGGGGGRGGRGGGRGHRGPRRSSEGGESGGTAFENERGSELTEKVVFINRSAKVVKGGRRFSFSALVVVGDKQGKVGLGLGKAVEVSEAIRKGGEMAKVRMMKVSVKDSTIPHEIFCEYGGAKIIMRPASPGTGIIAGKTIRSVVESVGIKDILTKSLGSNNPSNVVKAALDGLSRLRTREDIYRGRGIEIKPKEAPVAPAPEAPETGSTPA